jgi:hypothetical protein
VCYVSELTRIKASIPDKPEPSLLPAFERVVRGTWDMKIALRSMKIKTKEAKKGNEVTRKSKRQPAQKKKKLVVVDDDPQDDAPSTPDLKPVNAREYLYTRNGVKSKGRVMLSTLKVARTHTMHIHSNPYYTYMYIHTYIHTHRNTREQDS